MISGEIIKDNLVLGIVAGGLGLVGYKPNLAYTHRSHCQMHLDLRVQQHHRKIKSLCYTAMRPDSYNF